MPSELAYCFCQSSWRRILSVVESSTPLGPGPSEWAMLCIRASNWALGHGHTQWLWRGTSIGSIPAKRPIHPALHQYKHLRPALVAICMLASRVPQLNVRCKAQSLFVRHVWGSYLDQSWLSRRRSSKSSTWPIRLLCHYVCYRPGGEGHLPALSFNKISLQSLPLP